MAYIRKRKKTEPIYYKLLNQKKKKMFYILFDIKSSLQRLSQFYEKIQLIINFVISDIFE